MRTTRSLFLTVGLGGCWGWQSFVTVQGCAHALPTTDKGEGVQVCAPVAKDAAWPLRPTHAAGCSLFSSWC